MAINLTGTIREKVITELAIPRLERALVSGASTTLKTGIDAKSIKIWGLGNVTVGDYTGGDVAGTDFGDTSVDLVLDTAKYFKEKVENIDTYEAAVPVLKAILPIGAQAIGSAIDALNFAAMVAGAGQTVDGLLLDATNVDDFIGDIGVALDEDDVPTEGRVLTVSPAVAKLIAIANLDRNTSSAEEASRNGFLGQYLGFTIYKSNNLPAGKYVAAHPRGTAAGIGWNEMKIDEVSGQFYAAAMGLTASGVKVVEGKMIATGDVTLA